MKNVKKNLDDAFYVVFKVSKSKNKNNFSYKNLKKWDSLNHIKLILYLESKFKIKITPEQNFNLNSYKKILFFFKNK